MTRNTVLLLLSFSAQAGGIYLVWRGAKDRTSDYWTGVGLILVSGAMLLHGFPVLSVSLGSAGMCLVAFGGIGREARNRSPKTLALRRGRKRRNDSYFKAALQDRAMISRILLVTMGIAVSALILSGDRGRVSYVVAYIAGRTLRAI